MYSHPALREQGVPALTEDRQMVLCRAQGDSVVDPGMVYTRQCVDLHTALFHGIEIALVDLHGACSVPCPEDGMGVWTCGNNNSHIRPFLRMIVRGVETRAQ